jgi:hypothetical protein
MTEEMLLALLTQLELSRMVFSGAKFMPRDLQIAQKNAVLLMAWARQNCGTLLYEAEIKAGER